MRLILAALFFCVCSGLLVGAVEATVGLERAPPWLVSTSSFGVALGLTWGIFRERSSAATHADRLSELRRALASGARLEPDPALDFRFDFVSTQADLMAAEAVLRREQSGMRGWVRVLALLWAAMLLVPATLVVTVGAVRGMLPQGGAAIGTLVCLVYGGGAVWILAVRPLLHRRAIRRATAPAQELSLHFTPRGIDCVVAGVGRVRRSWLELELCLPSRKGVLLAFRDVNNWLPTRVFGDTAERKRFDACVAHRLAQEAVRSESLPSEHPILPGAASYTIVGLRHDERTYGGGPFAELTLRRGDEERRLCFLRPVEAFWREDGLEDDVHLGDYVELELENDIELARRVGVRILLLPHPELDGLAVHAIDAEDLGRLSILAEDVVDLGPSRPPPAERAGLRP